MRLGGDGVAQPLVAIGVDVILRPEGSLIQNVLSALIDDSALVPAEGEAMFLIFEEILTHLRPNFFEQVSEMRRDRIVAQNRVSRLNKIDRAEQS